MSLWTPPPIGISIETLQQLDLHLIINVRANLKQPEPEPDLDDDLLEAMFRDLLSVSLTYLLSVCFLCDSTSQKKRASLREKIVSLISPS